MKKKNKRIRVGFLIDTWFPFYGGGQVHIKNLREKLEKNHRIQSELFYSGKSNIAMRFLWALVAVVKIVHYHQKHPLTLIHSHGFIAGLPAKIASSILHIPVVHTVHGSHLMDKKTRSPKAWLERWLLTKIRYDTEITVAKNFLHYENVNQHLAVIPNGVTVTDFDAVKVKKNQNPTLIWVGRDHPDKGIEFLKEAITKVRKKIPKLEAILVTGGKLTEKRLITAYKHAHVFVLPSLAEGQPITLLEAWAAKLPVVVTTVGDNPELVKDGVNGFLIDPANSQQLTQAILKVLRSRKKGKSMGLSGYRLVKRRFTWDKVAKETAAVYQTLLQ